jgi:hypothetical protein
MNRKQRILELYSRLGRRGLIWYGTRGTDSQALLEFPHFSKVFSLIAPLGALSLELEVCLETLKGERVDLDAYRIATDTSLEALKFQRSLFESLKEPAVVMTYRSDPVFTALYYPSSEFVEYLGLFHERQAPFEHKPWVETELRKWGVLTVPRRYLRDDDRDLLEDLLAGGPVVARATRSDGGEGLALIEAPDEIDAKLPPHSDGFFSVAPYLVPNIPLNVNAVVFQDGSVSLHSPSLQLIGIPGLTNRFFGYCGNDFAQIRELDAEILDSLEETTIKVGKWLASMGYIGAFGIDALFYLRDGKVYLTEINPRFQGSSHLSSLIDIDLDRSDMFLEHMAAFWGLSPPAPLRLRDLAKHQRRISQVICHNCTPYPVRRNSRQVPETEDVECMLLPAKDVIVDPQAILFRAVIEGSVTEDGGSLRGTYGEKLQYLARYLFNADSSSKEDKEVR